MNTKVNEGKLISGKEALIALANGEDVESRHRVIDTVWGNAKCLVLVESFLNPDTLIDFRLKPKTIKINGIEVPAPFEPKEGEIYWCFSTQTVLGYAHNVYESERADRRFINMGAWRTEEEIKQVVAALRQVFGVSHDN